MEPELYAQDPTLRLTFFCVLNAICAPTVFFSSFSNPSPPRWLKAGSLILGIPASITGKQCQCTGQTFDSAFSLGACVRCNDQQIPADYQVYGRTRCARPRKSGQ